MRVKTFFMVLFFMVSLGCIAVQDADAARRFGGSKSFGSKPSMNRSTTAPTQQKPGVTQNAATAAKKPGLLGGAGGMLGGLLAGTLLGSLLFGGGFSGGGFMDILLIGLLAFLGFKLFTMFRRRPAPAAGGGGAAYAGYAQGQNSQTMQYQNTATSSQNTGGWGGLQGGSAQTAAAIPADFDAEEFLEGAKIAFSRLQKSWDKQDIDDIALFTSPAVLAEVKAQMAEGEDSGTHEILLNNAQLLSVKTEAGEEVATVFFDVIMREGGSVDTMQVREVWHFARPMSGGSWKLDGIQQIEN